MLRRCCFLRFSSYYVPQLSRVAIFPLHLDPPTKQHRHLFRALLGFRHGRESADDETMSLTSQSLGEKRHCEDCECDDIGYTSVRTGSSSRDEREKNTRRERGYAFAANMSTTTAFRSGSESKDNIGGESRQFWYMSSFEESLRMDSQLAPFDDIILIPNTRYPVSLRRSTHLAALAVLGTRGLPNVHVEFTALEHPDETMSVIHEFTQHYRNCALVHWLQDAYEMHDWRSFSQMKIEVPLLLLQTISLPTSQLAQRPPSRLVMQRMQKHPTRLYHAPTDNNITSESERHYYAQVRAHIQEMARQRLLEEGLLDDGALQTGVTSAEESCAGVQLLGDEDTTSDSRSTAARSYSLTHHADQDRSMPKTDRKVATQMASGEIAAVTDVLSTNYQEAGQAENVAVRGRCSDVPDSLQDKRDVFSNNAIDVSDLTNAGVQSSSGSSVCDHKSYLAHDMNDEEAHFYDRSGSHLCAHDQHVKGEWWLTPGGRGDDSVEVNKMYSQSEGSSWLGAVDACSSPDDSSFGTSGTSAYADEMTSLSNSASDADISGGAADFVFCKARAQVDVNLTDASRPTTTTTTGAAHATKSAPSSLSSASSVLSASFGMPGTSASFAGRSSSRRARLGQRNVRDLIQELYPSIRPLPRHVPGGASHRQHSVGTASYSAMLNDLPNCNSNINTAAAATASEIVVTQTSSRKTDQLNTTTTTDNTNNGYTNTADMSAECASREAGLKLSAAARDDSTRLIPMVEVQPVTRCTGADVRHALWTRELDPSLILTDCVLRYIESHMLYRDSRKALSMRGTGGLRKSGDPLHMHGMTSAGGGAMLGGGYHNSPHASSHGNNYFSHHSSHLPRPHRSSAWGDGQDGTTEILLRSGRGAGDAAGHGDAMRPAHSVFGGGTLHELYNRSSNAAHPHWMSTSGLSGASSAAVSSSPFSLTASGNSSLQSSPSASSSALYSASMGMMGNTAGAPYVHRPSLHRGGTSTMSYSGIIPRLELHYDRNNLVAREHYETLRVFECLDGEEPDLIVPIGGDGYMLHCIRENWRRFIPFYGVNAGHVGYLLNDRSTLDELFSSPLKLHTTTMLYCQAERESDTGEHLLISELAFNDAWIERAGGQTALIRVLVNGEERIRRFYGDGVLVSTPAGSTAYSRALGASPLPVGSPLIQVVGSNVVQPAQWRPVHLDQEDEVVFEVMDTVKRPCHCYVDSVSVGNVTHLLVRSSRVASVSLVFSKSFDLHQKLYALQFPQTL